jgi:hypothetical protein|tara:strand:+ start:286 stop:603 length:318 start_codon:yes stop_codon:yes gene_type:complete
MVQVKIECPDCDDGGNVRLVNETKHNHECYRCACCSGEFFPDEMKRTELRYSVFTNDDGRTVFIANTEKRKEVLRKQLEHARAVKRKRIIGTSRREKSLLRRIKK